MADHGKTSSITLETKPATLLSNQELADLMNLGFEGYVGGAFNFTGDSISGVIEMNYINLERSSIFYAPGESTEPVGFGLIALRDDKPDHARLAAMGVVPSFQGRRVGGVALDMIIKRMREEGIKVLELECIDINERGVKLYKRAGFTILRELTGWDRESEVTLQASNPTSDEAAGNGKDELQECSVQDVCDLVDKYGSEDLPWQAWGFRRSLTPQRAFHINNGEAYCVIAPPYEGEKGAADGNKITCLFVPPEHRGKGAALRLAKAMAAKFPEWKWTARVVFPAEYLAGIAPKAGFREKQARQYQMRLTL